MGGTPIRLDDSEHRSLKRAKRRLSAKLDEDLTLGDTVQILAEGVPNDDSDDETPEPVVLTGDAARELHEYANELSWDLQMQVPPADAAVQAIRRLKDTEERVHELERRVRGYRATHEWPPEWPDPGEYDLDDARDLADDHDAIADVLEAAKKSPNGLEEGTVLVDDARGRVVYEPEDSTRRFKSDLSGASEWRSMENYPVPEADVLYALRGDSE